MKDVRHIFKGAPRGPSRAAGSGVSDESSYLAVQREHLRRTEGPNPVQVLDPILAFVDEDRLLIDSLCGNGVPVLKREGGRADEHFAACVNCGRIYRKVVVPEDLDQGDAVLAKRPVRNRNWDPRRGETVADLVAENARHGLG
jgi:hypothetical protein